ncbi:GIY-YIG nuclease family protein [Chloroflexota bacterium]
MLRRKKKNICGYWDCEKQLPDNHFLCSEHYKEWEEGTLDRCPKCGRFKDVQYYLCLDDYFGRPVAKWEPSVAIPAPKQYHEVQYSEVWTDGYRQPERVFVYILKLADGGFYVGHTTDIRKRFAEHRDAQIASTAGRNPKLQYMEISVNQKAAELREDELKRLVESNPRQIQLMINKFHDHMVEFGLE